MSAEDKNPGVGPSGAPKAPGGDPPVAAAEPEQAERLRDERNKDLLRRMRAGESLTSFDSKASWFPPRPIIEKDPEAIKELYKAEALEKPKTSEKKLSKKVEPAKIVPLPLKKD